MRRISAVMLLLVLVAVAVLTGCATAVKDVQPGNAAQPDGTVPAQAGETAPDMPGETAGAASEPETPYEEPAVHAYHEEPAVHTYYGEPVIHAYEWMGTALTAYVYPSHAELVYPEGAVPAEAVGEFMAYVSDSYGYMFEGATYSVSDGKVSFDYPQTWGDAEFALAERILMENIPLWFGTGTVEPDGNDPVSDDVVEEFRMDPGERQAAGIEITGSSEGNPDEFSLEDIIMMYEPEYTYAGNDVSAQYQDIARAGSDDAWVDLSAFTWITPEPGDVQDAGTAEPHAGQEHAVAGTVPVQQAQETPASAAAAPVTAVVTGDAEPVKDSVNRVRTIISWIVWGLVGAGLLVLAITNARKRKKTV